jgi:hypothetical protein
MNKGAEGAEIEGGMEQEQKGGGRRKKGAEKAGIEECSKQEQRGVGNRIRGMEQEQRYGTKWREQKLGGRGSRNKGALEA